MFRLREILIQLVIVINELTSQKVIDVGELSHQQRSSYLAGTFVSNCLNVARLQGSEKYNCSRKVL